MKLTINQISDLLLDDMDINDKKYSTAMLIGRDEDGRKYHLYVKLELMMDE